MEYSDGKKLEQRYKELFALKKFQTLNEEQKEKIETELNQIVKILPDDVINDIERSFQEDRLQLEDKQDIFNVMTARLEHNPNWADFHLFDLFFETLTVRDGDLLERAREFRFTILDRRPLPRR